MTAKSAVGPEEEAFERRFHRLLAAFRPPGAIDEAVSGSADLEGDLLAASGGREGYADRFRRMFALRHADPADPRVDALAADMRAVMRVVVAGRR